MRFPTTHRFYLRRSLQHAPDPLANLRLSIFHTASPYRVPRFTDMSDRMTDIELRDLTRGELEAGVVPEGTGVSNHGSRGIIISSGAGNETVLGVDVNNRNLQLLSSHPSPSIHSTRRRRNLKVLSVFCIGRVGFAWLLLLHVHVVVGDRKFANSAKPRVG
jgi:hypothetical protein